MALDRTRYIQISDGTRAFRVMADTCRANHRRYSPVWAEFIARATMSDGLRRKRKRLPRLSSRELWNDDVGFRLPCSENQPSPVKTNFHSGDAPPSRVQPIRRNARKNFPSDLASERKGLRDGPLPSAALDTPRSPPSPPHGVSYFVLFTTAVELLLSVRLANDDRGCPSRQLRLQPSSHHLC